MVDLDGNFERQTPDTAKSFFMYQTSISSCEMFIVHVDKSMEKQAHIYFLEKIYEYVLVHGYYKWL